MHSYKDFCDVIDDFRCDDLALGLVFKLVCLKHAETLNVKTKLTSSYAHSN